MNNPRQTNAISADTDLLALAAELVAIPSQSQQEQALADHVQQRLSTASTPLEITRISNNVIARTQLGRPQRIVIAGHLDTVPAVPGDPDHLKARIEGDRLYGLGACDMKGSLAAQLAVATQLNDPQVDVSFVFYECEEIANEHNGLRLLFEQAPELLACDAALLGEPTSAMLEAGCQGTLRAQAVFRGKRAHTARPWKGVNAIHRLGELLVALTQPADTGAGADTGASADTGEAAAPAQPSPARPTYVARRPVIDGCEFREAIQAVAVSGGVAGNVVPDEASLTLNLRYAPDRTPAQAEAYLAEVVGECDDFVVTDHSPGALPALDHPLLKRLIDDNHLAVFAKLGWTDVARFAAHGIPAANFGAGDPTLAHTRDEFVERREIEAVHAALMALLHF